MRKFDGISSEDLRKEQEKLRKYILSWPSHEQSQRAWDRIIDIGLELLARDLERTGSNGSDQHRLTKREYFAAMVMATLVGTCPDDTPGSIANSAVYFADSLIQALATKEQV